MPASRKTREALAKLMAKGLSVEEIVRLDSAWEEDDDDEEEDDWGETEEMIQLKAAWASVGEVAYVTEGSHFQLEGLEVQFVLMVSRKVVKVQEPMGKGAALGEEVEAGAAGEALTNGVVSYGGIRQQLQLMTRDSPVARLFMEANSKPDNERN